MESSSQAYEECNSSESGWTMYIGSPPHDDDDGSNDDGSGTKSEEEEDGGDDDGNGNDNSKSGNRPEGEESDESMASDASSGPSYYRETNVPRGPECSSRNEKVRVQEKEVVSQRGRERRRPPKEEADRSEASSKARKNLKFQVGKNK